MILKIILVNDLHIFAFLLYPLLITKVMGRGGGAFLILLPGGRPLIGALALTLESTVSPYL